MNNYPPIETKLLEEAIWQTQHEIQYCTKQTSILRRTIEAMAVILTLTVLIDCALSWRAYRLGKAEEAQRLLWKAQVGLRP